MMIDKFLHFIVGFVLGAFAADIKYSWVGFLLGFLIVVVYELQQLIFHTGKPELLDILAGAIGLIISFFIFCHKTHKYY